MIPKLKLRVMEMNGVEIPCGRFRSRAPQKEIDLALS
jgi:hypothetical protein